MHSNHATWETGLVIPETKKTVEELTLEALLRIEEQLTTMLNVMASVPQITVSEPELDFDDEMNVIGTKKPKGKRKA